MKNTDNKIFRSCKYLEGSIIFSNDAIRFCCINQNEKPNPLYFLHLNDNNFDVDEIIKLIEEKRMQIRAEFNSNRFSETHYCRNCHLLEEKEWKQEKIFEVGIAPSDICNLECNYCNTRKKTLEEQKPKYDAMKILKGLIDKNMLKKDCHLVWNGGEPTLIKDFDILLSYVMEQGFNNNEVLTNSLKFSPSIYNFLPHRENYTFKIITSLDAGTEETYKKIKKVNGFNQVCDNLQKYASTGGDVIVKYIFTKENNNKKDVDGFLKFIFKSNIQSVLLDINRNYELSEYYKYRKMFLYMMEKLMQHNIKFWIGAFGVSDSNFIKEMNRKRKQLYKKYIFIKALIYFLSFGKTKQKNKAEYTFLKNLGDIYE